MRKRHLSVRQSLGFVLVAAGLVGGVQAIPDDPTPQTGATSLAQALPPSQTWEQRTRDTLRRLMGEIGGDPAEVDNKPVKSAATTVSLRFALFGLPSDLTASELQQIEFDSLELANCAEWDVLPPDGTSYSLIVLLHDLGKTVNAAATAY